MWQTTPQLFTNVVTLSYMVHTEYSLRSVPTQILHQATPRSVLSSYGTSEVQFKTPRSKNMD